MVTIVRPDHFTIVTDDLDATEEFYADILGLNAGPRPDFNFPGLWLYAGEVAVLHVVQVDEMPNPRKGALDHMALRGQDINALLQKLGSEEIPFRLKRTPAPWVQWQVFFQDPNGVDVEVDFDGHETVKDAHALQSVQ